MVATIDKLGEGAFADVFGCMKEDYTKLAIKVCCGHDVMPLSESVALAQV